MMNDNETLGWASAPKWGRIRSSRLPKVLILEKTVISSVIIGVYAASNIMARILPEGYRWLKFKATKT